NYLVRIRNHLHCQSGRKNDQLYFEHQEEMARALGYQDGDSLLAVEHFMREVHNRMQRVAVTTDLFFEYVEEVVGRTLPGAASRSREIVLEKGIIARQGRIHLAESAALAEKPYLLMRLFALAARRNLAIHHRTRKIIRENLSLITERLRKSGRLARNFLEVLHSPESCPVLLPTMLETGLLSAYLPEFAGVESLSFHNVYHIYTVDRHLVQTVLELGRLKGAEEKILSRISSPSVLYLAALLHDIGKGQGSGHSERGAVLAAQICFRLGLSKKEVSILSFLIRNHLFLAEIAMRRDLEDENLILSCARIVGTSERLDLLYLLIIADSRATGPNAWSRWKAALVQELYLKILHVLEQGDPVMMEADQDTAEDWMRSQVAALLGPESGVDAARIPADYLLSFTVREIERHVDLIAGMADRRVIVEPDRHSGHWSLLLITGDRPGLLARIFGVLTLNNLEVLNARVCTWSNGTVVDVLQIRSSIGNTYDDQDWGRLEEQLNLAVSHRLGLEYRLNGRSIETRRLKVPRQSRDKVEVRVDNEGSERFTIIEIFADRRFGLLYDITRTLSDFCLNIFRAKISTSGDQMVEVFYVQDEQGSKLRDKELVREVRNSLLHVAT
ncbi:MAG: HD domain-containing protein, partial [Desulfobia sp.]